MSKRCDLTGVGVRYGNNVSHSNRKTRRRFAPNLRKISLVSQILGRTVSLRITAATLRSVDHNGGLDPFLLTANNNDLTEEAVKLKGKIRKAVTAKEASAAPKEKKAKKPAKQSPRAAAAAKAKAEKPAKEPKAVKKTTAKKAAPKKAPKKAE
ncbi:MAG: ribosomal protein [Rickettsiaceae bacterium]|jgi:large subunit ribosomal protein L28|nr:ribosomal protein [Rickettsiaceae bacterium]